ncbi:hypothetical protein J132_00594 [Termitomyces sp. J132]|nr:hypothetical protein J132_00594 [Termitomyces sp. J132]
MARVKQTRNTNQKCQLVPFQQGEFAYMSIKNMNFPKGTTRKMIPKFVGPYLLLKDYGNSSFKVQIPTHKLCCGIHNVYHASLLRTHHPNDNRWFPDRLYSQVVAETEPEHETQWAADKIISHASSKNDLIFEVLWITGDRTWLPHNQVHDLNLLQPYLEAQGVNNISKLPIGTGKSPIDDHQTFSGSIHFEIYKTPSFQLPIHSNHSQLTSHHLLPSYLASHSQSPYGRQNMTTTINSNSFRLKDHYQPHPLLASHPDSLVQLMAINPNLDLHPLQLLEYIKYDNAVRRHNVTIDTYMPAGCTEFTATYNLSKGDNPPVNLLPGIRQHHLTTSTTSPFPPVS